MSMHDVRAMCEIFNRELDTARGLLDVLATIESLRESDFLYLYTRNAFDFLPTFGGPRVRNGRVYSYDADNLLVLVSAESGSPRRFAIIGRHEL